MGNQRPDSIVQFHGFENQSLETVDEIFSIDGNRCTYRIGLLYHVHVLHLAEISGKKAFKYTAKFGEYIPPDTGEPISKHFVVNIDDSIKIKDKKE